MRYPDGPFIELNFYTSHLSDVDAYHNLLVALQQHGAGFCGVGHVHRGVGIRQSPFASISDREREQVPLRDLAAVEQLLADPDVRLVQVDMSGFVGIAPDACELATYLSISEYASSVDHHPIAIWAEEADLFAPPAEAHEDGAPEQGRRIYDKFLLLVRALEPSYAAITSEWSLECPTDLRCDPRSLAFRNFYVSRSFIGVRSVARIRCLYSDAYLEDTADGLYVSCSRLLNPEGREIRSNLALTASARVAELIGSLRSVSG